MKQTAIILLAGVLACTLTACGQNGEETIAETTADTAVVGTVTAGESDGEEAAETTGEAAMKLDFEELIVGVDDTFAPCL